MQAVRVEARNIQLAYGTTPVLRDITLTVEPGEFFAILGPSGSGKSTLLRLIAGFNQHQAGELLVGGKDVTGIVPWKRNVGMVFQNYALWPHMTVARNVAFGLEERRLPRDEVRRRTAAALELVGLAGYGERRPSQLSGGQQQRVALARTLAIEPQVLLLDEPLSNLDAKLREEMQFELRRIQRKVGTTTIMVTHDQAEALSISDRVVVMEGGRMTQVDAPYRLYEHPKSEFISGFVGKTNLLAGTVARGAAGAEAVLGAGQRVRVDASGFAEGSAVTVCLRPEKLFFTDEARGTLAGKVEERFFLGSQWLYRVSSPLGELEVSAANDGSAPVEEQANVHLAWADDVARVVAKAP